MSAMIGHRHQCWDGLHCLVCSQYDQNQQKRLYTDIRVGIFLEFSLVKKITFLRRSYVNKSDIILIRAYFLQILLGDFLIRAKRGRGTGGKHRRKRRDMTELKSTKNEVPRNDNITPMMLNY